MFWFKLNMSAASEHMLDQLQHIFNVGLQPCKIVGTPITQSIFDVIEKGATAGAGLLQDYCKHGQSMPSAYAKGQQNQNLVIDVIP